MDKSSSLHPFLRKNKLLPVSFYEFDLSKRHCWGPNNSGNYIVENTIDIVCNDWKEHPLNAGVVHFLRWIREFGVLAPNIVTNFESGELKLGPQFCPTRDKEIYCEDYGGKIKCFLDRNNEVAIVEIYDASLLEAADKAKSIVDKQYYEMVN